MVDELIITSDFSIAIFYYAIPVQILYFLRSYPSEIPNKFRLIILLFASFTVLCGTTHLAAAMHMSFHTKDVNSILKPLTSFVSAITCTVMFFLIPDVLRYFLYTRQLELENAAKVKELAVANSLAKQANVNKDDFMAFLCHEIRNPLHVLCANTEFLQETKLTSEQREFVKSVHDSGQLMCTIVNDVLDISRLQNGHITFESIPVDLHSICCSVTKNMTSQAHAKSLNLTLDFDSSTPRFVISDPTRIHQLLMNLVSNAIKFTKEGSITVCVKPELPPASSGNQSSTSGCSSTSIVSRSISSAGGPDLSSLFAASETVVDINSTKQEESESRTPSEEHPVWIKFEVADTGCGISPTVLPRLFSPFTQATLSTARIHGGTGLGLAICYRLVKNLKGTITVRSEVGRGSTFSIYLPFKTTTSTDLNRNGEFEDSSPTSEAKTISDFGTLEEPINKLKASSIGGSTDEESPLLTGRSLSISEEKPPSLSTSILKSSLDKKPLLSSSSTSSCQTLDKSPILVVDDNKINQKILARMLNSLGHPVTVASDGQEAVNIVRSQEHLQYFSCIFMDLSMPVMDGYEATKHIRSFGCQSFIVALTANALKQESTKAEEAGMNAFLTKPIGKQKLVRFLKGMKQPLSS